jgi:hypothetical protein
MGMTRTENGLIAETRTFQAKIIRRKTRRVMQRKASRVNAGVAQMRTLQMFF